MSKALSDLAVRGDPNAVDSFVACLCAILEHFDRPADYNTIAALTGTCFAPCHNLGEECTGWKVEGGSAARAEWVASALGLSLNTIRLDEPAGIVSPNGSEWIEAYQVNGALPHAVHVYFNKICTAIEAGEVVMVATWPSWSVLTGWHTNLTMLPFSTTPGFEPVVSSIWPPVYTRIAFAMRPGGHALSQRVAMREALCYGAQIAAGQVSSRLDTEFGSAMYGVLAGLASQPYLCPSCRENACFGRAVKRIQQGLHSSVAFLKAYREYIQLGSTGMVLENLIEQYGHMQHVVDGYAGLDYGAELANQPDFRKALARDFGELKVMQVRVSEHFDALVEELTEYA